MKLRSLGRSLLAASALVAALSAQQTATYAFSTNNPGPYAPITGGLVLEAGSAIDDTFYNNVPIGFDFPFGGTASGGGWTNVMGVSTNGWAKLSSVAGAATTYNFASSTAQARTVGAFGRDLQAADANAEIRVQTIGAAPNRVCVIQWTNMRPWTSATSNSQILTMSFDFQVKLYETSGVIELTYGDWDIGSTAFPAATTSGSVGIKGNAASPVTDYKICTSTSTAYSWSAPFTATTSAANGHYVGTGAGKKPANGLIYRYTPSAFPPAGLTIAAAATPAVNFVTGMPLITATVSPAPATAPISNLAVTVDTTAIGGAPGQVMHDDGLNGDAVAGDGTYSDQATVYSLSTVAYTLPITASATGATNGSASATINVYTIANDVYYGAVPVARGQNGPFDNTNAMSANQFGFNTTCGAGSNGARDLFFVYTPSCTGTASFSTCGGDAITNPGELADSQMTIYDIGFNLIGCNDDAGSTSGLCGPSGYQSQIDNVAVTAGQLYLIRVAGYSATDVGQFYINISESSAVAATFGVSCGSYPLALSGTPPRLGQSGTMSIVNARPNAFGVLGFSYQVQTYAQLGPCPFYLDTAGSVAVLGTFTPDAAGAWSYTDIIPSDPAILCFAISLQAFTFQPDGFDSSNGLNLTFGY